MKWLLCIMITLLVLFNACSSEKKVAPTEHRCANCNMIVEKYPNWIEKAVVSAKDTLYFDGPRCMFKILLESSNKVASVLVKDYYSLKYIDGRTAFYVTGSDILGPMGNELIPFNSEQAARDFLNEHKGEKIVRFNDVDIKLVMRLAKGMEMK